MTPAPLPAGTDHEKVAKALKIFVIMAFIVGVGLLVLVLELVLKYAFHNDVLAWWPQPHGFIYFAFLWATANLGIAAGWPIWKMVGVMLSGCVPFLSFWVEHKVSGTVRQQLAELPVRAG